MLRLTKYGDSVKMYEKIQKNDRAKVNVADQEATTQHHLLPLKRGQRLLPSERQVLQGNALRNSTLKRVEEYGGVGCKLILYQDLHTPGRS